MANKWFRLYNEFYYDPKVQSLSEVMQRRWVMIMAMQSDEILQTLTDEQIAYALRISLEELDVTRVTFLNLKFIEKDWKIKNWNKRQFASDTSKIRTRRYRDRHKPVTVTSHERPCDALDTDTDTDTDTEEECKQEVYTLVNGKPSTPPKISSKSKKKEFPNCPYDQILEEFGKILPQLPQPTSLSDGRKKHILGRWKENADIGYFLQVFHGVQQSDFLMGRRADKNQRQWRASFDWIMTARNWEKIVDGNYDNE